MGSLRDRPNFKDYASIITGCEASRYYAFVVDAQSGLIVYGTDSCAAAFKYSLLDFEQLSLYQLLPSYIKRSVSVPDFLGALKLSLSGSNQRMLRSSKIRQAECSDGSLVDFVIRVTIVYVEVEIFFVAELSNPDDQLADKSDSSKIIGEQLVGAGNDYMDKINAADRLMTVIAGQPSRTMRVLGLILMAIPVCVAAAAAWQIGFYLVFDSDRSLAKRIFGIQASPTDRR